MPDGKYLIGESLREKLKSTIAKVDSISFGGPASRIPTALEDATPCVPKVFRVCTFTGAWAINSAKTLTFRGVTSTPNTVSATNLFMEFTQTTSTVNCAIAKDGTAWYLIAPTSVERKTIQTSVITNVSLGASGLQFTRLDIKIFETVSSSVITIAPVDQSVVTDVSLGAGGLQFTRRVVKVFGTTGTASITIGTTACT